MNCPICGKEIKEQFLGVRGNIISCENFCFENLPIESPSCPICNIGKMSKIKYHGNEYRQCDNNECNFEISSQGLITVMSKRKEFEKLSFNYYIKDDENPCRYKPLNDKIVRDVVEIINKHIKHDFTLTDEYIGKVTIGELRDNSLGELCTRFKIDELAMCGILIDIEQRFNICLCLSDTMKLKYFREIIFLIEEKLNEVK